MASSGLHVSPHHSSSDSGTAHHPPSPSSLSSPDRRWSWWWLLVVVGWTLTTLSCPVTCSALPSPPSRLSASEVTATSVKLSWDSGSRDLATSFMVQYRPHANASLERWQEETVHRPVVTVTQLKPFTQYEFRVHGVNSAGRGKASDPIMLTTGELASGHQRPVDGD